MVPPAVPWPGPIPVGLLGALGHPQEGATSQLKTEAIHPKSWHFSPNLSEGGREKVENGEKQPELILRLASGSSGRTTEPHPHPISRPPPKLSSWSPVEGRNLFDDG